MNCQPFLPGRRIVCGIVVSLGMAGLSSGQGTLNHRVWTGYGGSSTHAAQSYWQTQALTKILWQMPTDLNPPYSGGELLIHYGCPCITVQNTIIVPVKTGLDDGYRVEARRGLDGSLVWRFGTNFISAPHGWIPSYGPTLVRGTSVAWADSGGRVQYKANADAPTPGPTPLVFYGLANYEAASSVYDENVRICTPLTSGPDGSVYFGFRVLGDTPLHLRSGMARVGLDGIGSYVAAGDAAGDQSITVPKMNAGPAIGGPNNVLYEVFSGGDSAAGYLVGFDPSTLLPKFRVRLKDPKTHADAIVDDSGTAAPLIGPDGDVYFGTLENPFGHNHLRGYLLHYSGDLALTKLPGAFGWDDTPSIVPAGAVPFYHGTSQYLLFCKYNNYVEGGGDGVNRVALIDPTAVEFEQISQTYTMYEVASQKGPTRDPRFGNQYPNAVREWCINSGAIDVPGKAAIVNSEDGSAYKWDFTTNKLSPGVKLSSGIGEAYTPTAIGPYGTCYAINNATLFALGGNLSTFLPNAVSLWEGSSFSGSLSDILYDDTSYLTIGSTLVYGMGQIAAAEEDFKLPTGSYTAMTVNSIANAPFGTTMLIYVYNTVTRRFDWVGSYPVQPGGDTTVPITIAGTASQYIDGNGKVRVVTRSLGPGHYGSGAPFTLKINLVGLAAS